MKKVSILFAILFAFAASIFAQTDVQSDIQAAPIKGKREHKEGKGNHAGAMDMKKQLNLTTDQEASMKKVGDTYRGKMKAIKTDNSLSAEQKKAQFTDMQKAHNAEVKGILNADQYAKFTELNKNRADKMKAHKGKGGKGEGKGGQRAGMDMKKQLNLTTDQEAKMKDMRKAYGDKMKAVHSDNTLNQDQKKAKFSELQKSHDGEMKSLLNADQYAKFTELKKQRQDNMKAHKGERKGKKQGNGEAPAPKSN